MATAPWRQQIKRDSDANWALVAASFIPLDGEICFYKTSKKMKVGDGVTPIGSLPFSGGEDDYEKLTNKPIYVTQTVYENDQTGTTGMLLGQTVYKIADSMAQLNELIGGTLNGDTAMTGANVMDVTAAMATLGITANTVAHSPSNFSQQMDFDLISCDAAIVNATYYTNIPSAGVWVKASITSVALKPASTIEDLYKTFFLPETDASNVGQAMQVGTDGKWTAGAQIPIIGVQSWREIQRNVKLGRGATLYPVHTILNVRHKKFGSIPFEVVAHDVDADPDDGSAHTMTLLMLEGLFRDSQSYAFDEREKLCNCPSGLAAGSYYADLYAINGAKSARGTSWGTGSIYGWTLTQAVPSGGYLAFDIDYYNTWEAISITSYASDGTAIETVAVTADDTSGTDITTVISLSNINFGYCARYGSSNYKQSAIRQWLIASGSGWWTAKTDYDLPPDYVDDDGFFGGLDSEFAGILLATEQVTSTSKEYEEIETVNSSYTLADKIFLASDIQIAGYCSDQAATEGTEWPAFTGLGDSDEPARVKFKHGTVGTEDAAVWWWLRSPYPGHPRYARSVGTDGNTYTSYYAYGRGYAVVAACVI